MAATLWADPNDPDNLATIMVVGVPGTREQATVTKAREALERDIEELLENDLISFAGLTGSPFRREASLNATTRALMVALPLAVLLCFLVNYPGVAFGEASCSHHHPHRSGSFLAVRLHVCCRL